MDMIVGETQTESVGAQNADGETWRRRWRRSESQSNPNGTVTAWWLHLTHPAVPNQLEISQPSLIQLQEATMGFYFLFHAL